MSDTEKTFKWNNYPEAWSWLTETAESFKRKAPGLAALTRDMFNKAGVRLIDWVDHVLLRDTPATKQQLIHFGYTSKGGLFSHPGALLPRVKLGDREGLAIKVDNLAQFLMVRGLDLPIQGSPFSRYRCCEFLQQEGITLNVVEHRWGDADEPVTDAADTHRIYRQTLEKWQIRCRHFKDESEAMAYTETLAREQVSRAGVSLAAFLFFEAERRYWQARNRAAAIEKARLDSLGLGWAAHDHHTFRGSRHNFASLIRIFALLGFQVREKFYAGNEAGWGAQVMENPDIAVTLFLDVDLAPEELNIDFMQQGLPPSDHMGTVGLWCGIHGDSVLQAGLHHIALQADFSQLTEVLMEDNVKMMKPFSSLPFLQQAFTYGERWMTDPNRIRVLEKNGRITADNAEAFIQNGAVGSHLENIQRADGYKGFSQKEVSAIIRDTDPTHYRFQ